MTTVGARVLSAQTESETKPLVAGQAQVPPSLLPPGAQLRAGLACACPDSGSLVNCRTHRKLTTAADGWAAVLYWQAV